MFSGGRLCSFQTASCRHSATGGVSGESGEGIWHSAGRLLPAYLLLPAVSSEWQALCQNVTCRPSAWWDMNTLSNPVWWKDVNILVMFRVLIHSLTHRIMANGGFPKKWHACLWLTEAEQVGREIKKTGGGMLRAWGETLRTSELGEERATICKQQNRELFNVGSKGERSKRTHMCRAEMTWLACDLAAERIKLRWRREQELHGSFRMTTATSWGLSLFERTFRRMQQAVSHSSTARSRRLNTIILLGMLLLGLGGSLQMMDFKNETIEQSQ